MNPGAVEEGGKVADTLIKNLKDQPVTLALILFNMIFVAAIYFSGLDVRNHQDKIMGTLIEQNGKATELLSRCVVQPRTELWMAPLLTPPKV